VVKEKSTLKYNYNKRHRRGLNNVCCLRNGVLTFRVSSKGRTSFALFLVAAHNEMSDN